MTARRRLVGPDEQTSVRRQCELLGVSRSSVYYVPVEPEAEELELMRRIDEIHLEFPFYGSRTIARELRERGYRANRKRVQRLMRLMGLESVAPKPNTSKPNEEHPVYPYLLRGLTISRPNQVWAADITYIPLARGSAYLVAIMDWHSRRVLSWRLSNTLDASFCVEALQEALSALRPAGDLQLGSGFAVHVGGLHRRLARGRSEDQHGRQGPVHRQRLRRTALAFAEVRGRLPEGLHEPRRGARRDRALLPVLQHASIAPGARSSDASRLLRWTTGTGRLMMQGGENAVNPRARERGCGSCRRCGRAKRTARPQRLGKRCAFPTAPTAQTEGLSTTATKDVQSEQATPKPAPFWSEERGRSCPQCSTDGE